MKRLLLTLAALLGACDGPTVPADSISDVYDYRLLLTPQPLVLRWPAGSRVRVYPAPGTDTAANIALENALDAGAQAWNDALLYNEVRIERTTELEAADAVLLFSGTARPVDVSSCLPRGGFAYTTFCLTEAGNRLAVFPLQNGAASRVKFLITISSMSPVNAEAVRRYVAHELGHVLGLAQHSPRASDLMYGDILTRDEPSLGDRATVQVLYHTRADIVP